LKESINNGKDIEILSMRRYSDACHPIIRGEQTKINPPGHVKVKCWHTLTKQLLFYNFYGVPVLNDKAKSKQEYWNAFPNSSRPPNILIFGLDSTSRLNFKRKMIKTRKLFQTLQFQEMYGYTKGWKYNLDRVLYYRYGLANLKIMLRFTEMQYSSILRIFYRIKLLMFTVGDNTFPNYVPMTTSYSESDLTKICYNRWEPIDECPFIWKQFSDAHYLTGLLEDAPALGTFNYMKMGFLHPPVDFYGRPLMIAAYEKNGRVCCSLSLIKMTRTLYNCYTNLMYYDCRC